MWYRSSQWNDWLGLSWWSVCSPFQSFQWGVHCKDWQSYHSIDYSTIHCTKVCFNHWVYNKDGGGEISALILQVFNLHIFFIFKSKNKEKKMERAYESKHIFELKLHFYKDLVNLHYERLNILSLFCYYGYHYCFCSKYNGCVEDYNVGSHLCLLYQIPIHFPNFEEFLDGNQFHLANLKKYVRKLYPFLLVAWPFWWLF